MDIARLNDQIKTIKEVFKMLPKDKLLNPKVSKISTDFVDIVKTIDYDLKTADSAVSKVLKLKQDLVDKLNNDMKRLKTIEKDVKDFLS